MTWHDEKRASNTHVTGDADDGGDVAEVGNVSDAGDDIVRMRNVNFAWRAHANPVLAIDDFRIRRGERVFLQGPSGSGKTTLLNLIAVVLSPQSGTISVDDVPLERLERGQRDRFRVDRIGLVFQQFNLLPFLSVSANIQLPCRFSKRRRQRAIDQGGSLAAETDRLLWAMNLSPTEVQGRSVTELSVGQQQRVAVARALIGRPPLVVADEPTSALDTDARQAFLELLFAEVAAAGTSLLFVSHDASLATGFDRRLDLREINAAGRATAVAGHSDADLPEGTP